ncbi:YheE family protein [Bacillus sp. CGMCC 1.16541]|uniref:YheE family protein n=1 Tax=Bacillus sp. CGMCC 1.16541 TaxID=2185143 RepID=UPI000D73B58E|nr:YheE family protein [Bacillus sp. CGMCC 1.16541]
MISHFQVKPLYEHTQLPGWTISFYFNGHYYQGEYKKDGAISWDSNQPSDQYLSSITSQIHELMLFHVYEK